MTLDNNAIMWAITGERHDNELSWEEVFPFWEAETLGTNYYSFQPGYIGELPPRIMDRYEEYLDMQKAKMEKPETITKLEKKENSKPSVKTKNFKSNEKSTKKWETS